MSPFLQIMIQMATMMKMMMMMMMMMVIALEEKRDNSNNNDSKNSTNKRADKIDIYLRKMKVLVSFRVFSRCHVDPDLFQHHHTHR